MSEVTIELVMARIEEGGKTLRLNVLGMMELNQCIRDHLKLVQNLELHHNQLKKLDLESATLESLSASNNEFSGMMRLGFPKLQKLDLSYNLLTGVSFTCRSIQHLNLESNNLQKIDFLSNLKDLRVLNLGQNNLEKLDFLVFNTQLEELNIRKNRISTLKGAFSNTPKLRILDASGNRITETLFIDQLPELEELNISRNAISQLKMENKNENLNILDISYNQLDDLRILEFKYPYLTHCYIQNNQIYATTSVNFLKLMTNLIEVQFQDNPFNSTEYEDEFIVACPWLELINGREVGKPAQYVKQEVLNLKQHLESLDITVNNFHLSDLEETIVTEERLKAILRVQGFQDDDEKVEEKDENIMKEEEFQRFVTESNEQMSNIRANYFTRLMKNQNNQDNNNYDNSIQNNGEEMRKSQVKEIQGMSESQVSLGRKLIIRSVPKPQKKQSVLQEISQLKQSMKTKEFQQSLGFRDQRMNLSSENFNLKKNTEQRSSSSSRQQGQVRLPKI